MIGENESGISRRKFLRGLAATTAVVSVGGVIAAVSDADDFDTWATIFKKANTSPVRPNLDGYRTINNAVTVACRDRMASYVTDDNALIQFSRMMG